MNQRLVNLARTKEGRDFVKKYFKDEIDKIPAAIRKKFPFEESNE